MEEVQVSYDWGNSLGSDFRNIGSIFSDAWGTAMEPKGNYGGRKDKDRRAAASYVFGKPKPAKPTDTLDLPSLGDIVSGGLKAFLGFDEAAGDAVNSLAGTLSAMKAETDAKRVASAAPRGGGSNMPGWMQGLGGPPSIGQAPTFNRTLTDYLTDASLNKIAADQIRSANAELWRENRATKRDGRSQIQGERSVSANLQGHMRAAQGAGGRQERALAREGRNDRKAAQQELEQSIDNIASSIIDDSIRQEADVENEQFQREVAAQAQAEAALQEQIGAANIQMGQGLSEAEAMQSRMNETEIRDKMHSALAENREQAADNWLKRPEILTALASQAMQQDLQAAQLAQQAWSTQATLGQQQWTAQQSAMDSWRTYQLQKQELQMKKRELDAAMATGAIDPDTYKMQLDAIWKMDQSLGEYTGNSREGTDPDGNPIEIAEQRVDTLPPEELNRVNAIRAQHGWPPLVPKYHNNPQAQVMKPTGGGSDWFPWNWGDGQ